MEWMLRPAPVALHSLRAAPSTAAKCVQVASQETREVVCSRMPVTPVVQWQRNQHMTANGLCRREQAAPPSASAT